MIPDTPEEREYRRKAKEQLKQEGLFDHDSSNQVLFGGFLIGWFFGLAVLYFISHGL